MYFAIIAVVWILCPFFLIPYAIHLKDKCKRLERDNKIFKDEIESQGGNPDSIISAMLIKQRPQPRERRTVVANQVPVSNAYDNVATQVNSTPVNPVPVNTASANAAQVNNIPANPAPVRTAYSAPGKKRFTSAQLLFSIGVLCILIAGLIFATTNWAIMPVFMKISVLFLAVFVFMGLSLFFEKKLQLHETSVALYSLGGVFLPLTIVAIGYFAWISPWFSFSGGGRFFLGCTCFVFLTLAFVIGKLFYGYKLFDILSYISSSFAVILLIKQICKAGDLVMLVSMIVLFGAFLFVERDARKGEIRRDAFAKTAAIICIALAVVACFTNIACGLSNIMILVYLLCHIMLTCISLMFAWDILYYFVPGFGMLLAVNVSNLCKDIFPDGQNAVLIVLFAVVMLVYRYVRIGKRRLFANGTADGLFAFEMLYSTTFGVAASRFVAAEDSKSMVYYVAAFFIVTALMLAEYLYTLRTLPKKDFAVTDHIHLIIVATSGFLSMYGMMFSNEWIESDYFLTLIPLGIYAAAYISVGGVSCYLKKNDFTSYKLRYTELLLTAFTNIALVIAGLAFSEANHDTYIANIPLIVVVIAILAFLWIKKDNRTGVVAAIMLPVVLYTGIRDSLEKMIEDGYKVSVNTTFEIEMLILFAVFITGIFLYRKIIDFNKDEGRYMFDWNLPVQILMIFYVAGEYGSRIDHGFVRIMVGVALILFYASLKLQGLKRKLCYSAISLVFMLCMWGQDYITVAKLYESEWYILTLLLVAFVNLKVMYREELDADKADTAMYILCVVSTMWQVIDAMSSGELFDVIVLSIALLLMIVAGFIRKSKRWFLFGAITLIFVILYVTRDFWTSIAWWVYLLVAGCVLITLAATNEYRKKNGGTKAIIKGFFGDWER